MPWHSITELLYIYGLKTIFFFLFFTAPAIYARCQDPAFVYTDTRMLSIPRSLSNSTDSIASFVDGHFKTEKDKMRAIYRWVTYNIKYDPDSMYVFNWGADPGMKVTAAMRRRKGVCENYTAVFCDIAQKCRLRSYAVSGYTKQSGRIDRAGHSWCAVFVDGEWSLCDPTWDEGYVSDARYFLVPPSVFIESHIPFDPIWQLLDEPVTGNEFYKSIFNAKNNSGNNISKQSINDYLQLNELEKLEATASRIRAAGIVNELGKTNLAYVGMQIAIINEEKSMHLYNNTVDDLNKATALFNDFVEYRNKQFTPERSDAEINSLLVQVDDMLVTIRQKIDRLDSLTKDLQYDTESLQLKTAALTTRLEEQKQFLKSYFSRAVEERKKMFYR